MNPAGPQPDAGSDLHILARRGEADRLRRLEAQRARVARLVVLTLSAMVKVALLFLAIWLCLKFQMSP